MIVELSPQSEEKLNKMQGLLAGNPVPLEIVRRALAVYELLVHQEAIGNGVFVRDSNSNDLCRVVLSPPE